MGLIEEFIARYRKEYDFYDQAARLIAQLLDSSLQSAGIRSIVTSRAKAPSRLEDKVRKRSSGHNYDKLDDIYADIVDLAGVRVALYFPGERDQVGRLISDLFNEVAEPIPFPEGSQHKYEKRFSGYWATHYRVRLRETLVNEAQRRYLDAVVEIQVASVLMHAWAEVEHDLVYKPLQGPLSDDEYAILDELNGLVMAGEIALERLQRAGEARVASSDRQFENHYELAAYLLEQAKAIVKGPDPEAALGRIDLLFALLARVGLLTPKQLRPYLAGLSDDTETRPLAEQIVDRLVAEDEEKYRIYEGLRASKDWEFLPTAERASDTHRAIGFFLSQWIQLERLVREIVLKRSGQHNVALPTGRLLEKLQISNAEIRSTIERMRRLRNYLVHGIEVPPAEDIREAGTRLEMLLPELRRALDQEPGQDTVATSTSIGLSISVNPDA